MNQMTLVALYVFDSLKRTKKSYLFVNQPTLVILKFFDSLKRVNSFMNRTTLVTLCLAIISQYMVFFF